MRSPFMTIQWQSLFRPLLTIQLAVLAGVGLSSLGCQSPRTNETMSDQEPIPAHKHHTIDYLELTVTDMKAAKSFYSTAFGWAFNDYGPEYAGIQREEGGEVGGLRLDSTVAGGGALLVLYSSDLEASVESVRAAGGEIAKDIFSFPGGRRFQFIDLAGNELAVWSDQ
ncbi:MAG: putative enzyme related to lactoylglutathione lyase [Planctomycetota bacterium]|jgi:predicted enzyme related to lactoylglutathione lyase